MSEADNADLITAQHPTPAILLIVIWDNLNTHRHKTMLEFTPSTRNG